MVRNTFMTAVLMVAMVALGCNRPTKDAQPISQSKSDPKSDDKNLGPTEEGKKYLLAAEPSGAKGVVEVRKDASDGDAIVMVGRIAGSKKPFVDGRASFSVIDLEIKPCGLEDDESCEFPWDCCCTPKNVLFHSMANIKFEGPDGKTLGVSAKELLGVKEMAIVVVTGKANRDDKGNLTVVANGLHVRSAK